MDSKSKELFEAEQLGAPFSVQDGEGLEIASALALDGYVELLPEQGLFGNPLPGWRVALTKRGRELIRQWGYKCP